MINKIKKLIDFIKTERKKQVYNPVYRLAEIYEDNDEYFVEIQLINQSIGFNMKPEEILANDEMVDLFSPRDIRTLTYLGYLGINAPKYKILAKKLSSSERTVFVIKKKGENSVILKTADQVINETDIIFNMSQDDSNTMIYTATAESRNSEKLNLKNCNKC